MKRHHDLGGDPGEPMDLSVHPAEPWAKLITATMGALRSRGYLTIDEMRRSIEDLPPEVYDQAYFVRWAEALTNLLDEKGLVPRAEVTARMDQLRVEFEGKR
jgi:hypothetical protein